jgi:epoxyqueuosine reductase QueG
MEERIHNVIRSFVRESEANRFSDGIDPYFEEPLIGFAAADDAIFTEYKRIIGDFHLTPKELAAGLPEWADSSPVTVISWILPIISATRESNRTENTCPSLRWSQTRSYGENFNGLLRKHLVASLTALGYNAFAPQLHPAWRELAESPVGIASTWSERHAAYAAGLGTFSLNDALITPKGIAHRCGSVITSLKIMPTIRTSAGHLDNCLFFREGTCGLCITRCPFEALSKSGHDKYRCREYVYGVLPGLLKEKYGVPNTGCGLCQTRVPCEKGIPAGRKQSL